MQQEDEGLTRRKNSYLDVLIKHHQPHSMQSREAQTGVLSLARRTEQDGGGVGGEMRGSGSPRVGRTGEGRDKHLRQPTLSSGARGPCPESPHFKALLWPSSGYL